MRYIINGLKLHKHFICLCLLIIITSALSLSRLGHGSSHIPQTSWVSTNGEYVVFDLGASQHVRFMSIHNGHFDRGLFHITSSNDGERWYAIHTQTVHYTPYQWRRINFPANTYARFIEIRPIANHSLQFYEVGVFNAQEELIPIVGFHHYSKGAYSLIDEQHLIVLHPCFMLGIYFDEVHHVRTAHDYVHGNRATEWTHPPMGKNLIAAGIAVGGMNPFSWRLPGAIAGILMIPLMYALAKALFRSNNWALFASVVFAFDFMRFVQTRIATLDSFLVLFVMAMYLFMLLYIQRVKTHSFKHTSILLILCGISTGLAIATKWQGVYALIGLPILFAPSWFRLLKDNIPQAIKTIYICILAFLVVPFVIYAASYIPFVIGNGAYDIPSAVRMFWNNQVDMFSFHSGIESDHRYGSPWWEWPLMLTPFHYFSRTINGYRHSIIALGNPAIWWFGIPALLWGLFRLIKPSRENVVLSKKERRLIKKKEKQLSSSTGG